MREERAGQALRAQTSNFAAEADGAHGEDAADGGWEEDGSGTGGRGNLVTG
jgi:hypothetical protein